MNNENIKKLNLKILQIKFLDRKNHNLTNKKL